MYCSTKNETFTEIGFADTFLTLALPSGLAACTWYDEGYTSLKIWTYSILATVSRVLPSEKLAERFS